ncbi:rod shape-determining protein MreD [Pedobacter sp. BS3]|uniref:rod shape-determining protein MreD n=1 Tax=Pedobacter sp. BS3 TaxID=2567937 RepID=UPI0011ED6F3F|nr:rod shape-determining protein MreD [Pedobacter sp. BS3]TZF82069.1 rod shape-determining protein MreD [Pedobacter sp. BS3]
MSRVILANLVRFFLLVFIQVFLLKNIGYYNLATPFIYILFIMRLPFDTPNWLLFLLAFCTGLTVDAFYDTTGINAAACSVLAWVRVMFISVTVQRDGFDNEPEPSLGIMGFRWFFLYTIILALFHHITLFLLETFHVDEIQYTLMRILFSWLLTVFLIMVYEFIFYKKKER